MYMDEKSKCCHTSILPLLTILIQTKSLVEISTEKKAKEILWHPGQDGEAQGQKPDQGLPDIGDKKRGPALTTRGHSGWPCAGRYTTAYLCQNSSRFKTIQSEFYIV